MLKRILPYLFSLIPGLLFLPVPLLRDFHFESALIAATVGCFWAGIKASSKHRKIYPQSALKVLGFIYLAGTPLFLYSLFSGCLTLHGIGFWILFPIPSVFFGTAIGRLFRKLKTPAPRVLTVLAILFIALGGWLLEFLTLPQVYFFNHVWGSWPGPIYDETVEITIGLIFFRFLTLLWILLLWILPNFSISKANKTKIALLSLFLVIGYFFTTDFGVITPRSYLKQQLPLHKQTEHFDLYFDKNLFTQQEIEYWSLRHEFHFQQIVNQLEIDWPEDQRIESYLYANAWQKKKLVGAKFTSYVPIWLSQDQLHIAKQQLNGVLKHELVHVISKQFGNSLFNGSWSIGLVEGVAEAIAADASPQSTLDQILAADPPYPTVEQMSSALTTSGFYSSASAISYTTAGSFVNYLLKNYPADYFKTAYPSADFKTAYRVSFDSLVIGWQQTLPPIEIDSVDRQVSELIFSQRSLFQRFCPHAVSKELSLWDDFLFHEASLDSASSEEHINSLYELDPSNLLIKREWIRSQLRKNNTSEVLDSIDNATDSLLTFAILKADAFALKGDWGAAKSYIESLKPRIDTTSLRTFRYSYELRSDSLSWITFLNSRYKNQLPEIEDFATINTANQLLVLAKAIELKQNQRIQEYSPIVLGSPLHTDWFDIYEDTINQLVFLNETEAAQTWVNAVSSLDLRARYEERLLEQQEWLNFINETN